MHVRPSLQELDKQNSILLRLYSVFNFSQKLTSWVFNDQPCECAVVGQSRTNRRAAKIGWEKILSPILWHGSDFSYTKNSARPGSDFIYTKNSARPRADFTYTKNSAWPGSNFIYTKNFIRKSMNSFKNFPRCARPFVKSFLRKVDDMF